MNIIPIIFSHILPAILGFFSIILMINGVMDRERNIMITGIGIFIIAAILPFIVLPFIT
ncbi:MAG: conserved hypothetical protein [Methanobrevibacter sp. CfCl-M3]